MRIGELFLCPRPHRFRDLGRDRRRCLVIEVDHAAIAAARSRIRRHSPTNRCTSASLVSGPKLTRMVEPTIAAGSPIASSTRLDFMLPEEQALPADAAI